MVGYIGFSIAYEIWLILSISWDAAAGKGRELWQPSTVMKAHQP
jgi:hypothetical protein